MPNGLRLSSCLFDWRAVALAAAMFIAGACGGGALDPTVDTESPSDAPVGTASDSTPAGSPDTPAPDSLPATAPPAAPQTPPPSTQTGIPFGFFMGDYYQLGPTWTATLRGASVGAVVKYLEIARQRGARVFI